MSMQSFQTVTMAYFSSQVFAGNVRFYDSNSNFVEISCTDNEIIELYEKLERQVERIKEIRKAEAEEMLQEME